MGIGISKCKLFLIKVILINDDNSFHGYLHYLQAHNFYV